MNFASIEGNIATGTRKVTGWPLIINLKADPNEKMWKHGELGYLRWYADNMWIFVPIQQVVKDFFANDNDYPNQSGSSLNAAGINYNTLKAAQLMKKLESFSSPRN